jgi:hypothetical protein
MALNPKVWYPVAVGAAVVNLVAVPFFMGTHSAIHAVLAVGFGLWAQRLRQRQVSGDQLQVEAGSTQQLQDGFEALEAEVVRLRRELVETQERVDFVERVLAQSQEAGRLRK